MSMIDCHEIPIIFKICSVIHVIWRPSYAKTFTPRLLLASLSPHHDVHVSCQNHPNIHSTGHIQKPRCHYLVVRTAAPHHQHHKKVAEILPSTQLLPYHLGPTAKPRKMHSRYLIRSMLMMKPM